MSSTSCHEVRGPSRGGVRRTSRGDQDGEPIKRTRKGEGTRRSDRVRRMVADVVPLVFAFRRPIAEVVPRR